MTLLEAWVQTPGAAALGWTLVHSLWQGAIAAFVLALALCLLRSSRARYAAGCLVMLGLLAAFAVTFNRVTPEPRMQRANLSGVLAIPPAPDGLDAQWQAIKRQAHAEDYLPWLAPFWIAGVFAFHLRSLTSWMATRRLRRTGVCCAPDQWQSRLDRLSARLRLTRPVTLLESCLTEAPAVIGHIRPVILMPLGLLSGLPAGQIEAILLHELAHIRRHDYLANLAQIFVEGLLFYHPAVWWISNVIRSERENCCDDLVVEVQGGAYEYATALAALEQFRGPREALAATGGNLVKRIRRLLAPPQRPSTLSPIVTAAILTVTVVTALTAWQSKDPERIAIPPAPTPQAPVTLVAQAKKGPAPRPPAEIEGPYKKWVIEDVLYIIKDDEKQAFNRLESDAEREKFIEQFWARRDPTPGSVANEFKLEHYRRIAYANERYSAGIPGWKTDRGRIYIHFGPPDQMEAHPAGSSYQPRPEPGIAYPIGKTFVFPVEKWRYAYIEGVGDDIIIDFVDRMGNGDYRMEMAPALKDDLLHIWSVTVTAKNTSATLQVMGNTALVSIPLAAYGDHVVNVYGRATKEGKVLNVFESTVTGPTSVFRQYTQVRPGSNSFYVIVKDITTGQSVTDTVEFEVK